MEEDGATATKEVFSEAQMMAIASVVGGLLEQVLKDGRKDGHSGDARTSQALSIEGSNTQGEQRTI